MRVSTRHDAVNSPSHYTQYKGLEVIDLTEQMNFNRGNAVKYIARAGAKDPAREVEDLEKARWYIEREIQRVKANQPKPPELARQDVCGCCVMGRERAHESGYKFGYCVAGPILGVLGLAVVVAIVARIAEAVW